MVITNNTSAATCIHGVPTNTGCIACDLHYRFWTTKSQAQRVLDGSGLGETFKVRHAGVRCYTIRMKQRGEMDL